MAVELGTGYVSLVPSARGFGGAVAGVLGSELTGVGEQAGGQVSDGLVSRFTSGIGGLAVAGAAAAVGVGVAAFQIGASFDDAYDTIQVGTGATGEALEGLQDTFRNVVRDVPTDFGSAADAITSLSQRLHLTGEPLEALSSQFLNLSRITDTDLNANLETGTRLFGDWGIAAEDGAGALDQLFRAGQASGVAFDQLASTMVTFGAPLRQLGFSFEESAAMIAQFEAQGVNAELVMGSMRQALGRMARAGEDPIETFRRVTWQIENAGSASEANGLALELFGARAGPDMAAAIREGRFELDSLVDTISNGSSTIEGAAADTADFSEKWTLFKNRVLLALEPIAMRVFDFIGQAMDRLGPIADRVIANIQELLPTVQQYLGPVVEFISGAIDAIVGLFRSGGDASDEMGTRVSGLVGVFTSAFGAVQAIVGTVVAVLTDLWRRFGDDLIQFTTDAFSAIQQVLDGAVQILTGIFDLIKAILTGKWGEAWDAIKQILSGAWDAINGILDAAFAVVRGIIEVGMGVVSALWSTAWNGLKTLLSDIWNGIKAVVLTAIASVIDFVRNLPGAIVDAIGDLGRLLYEKGRDLVQGFIDGIRSMADDLLGVIGGLPGGVLGRGGAADLFPQEGDATGGKRAAFQGGWVGEAGREYFIPTVPGLIVPSHKLMDLATLSVAPPGSTAEIELLREQNALLAAIAANTKDGSSLRQLLRAG